MTIPLGSLALDNNVQLRGGDAISKVILNITKAIMGKTIITYSPAPAGHQLELVAIDKGTHFEGFFLKSQIDAMKELRDTVQTVALAHYRGSYNVIITAVDVEPLGDIVNPDDDWLYFGTIQLLTV